MAYIINRFTGQRIEIDPERSRVIRLQRRVSQWVKSLDPLPNYKVIMVTLTYAQVDGWKPNDIREFMLSMRAKYKVLAYAWVAELQQRGAVHYHCLFVVPFRTLFEFPDREGGEWLHGMTRVEVARTMWYICKYISKGYFDTIIFPKSIRIFAVFISQDLMDRSSWCYYRYRASALPGWVRDKYGMYTDDQIEEMPFPSRCEGGGWMLNNERLVSDWAFSLHETMNPKDYPNDWYFRFFHPQMFLLGL